MKQHVSQLSEQHNQFSCNKINGVIVIMIYTVIVINYLISMLFIDLIINLRPPI